MAASAVRASLAAGATGCFVVYQPYGRCHRVDMVAFVLLEAANSVHMRRAGPEGAAQARWGWPAKREEEGGEERCVAPSCRLCTSAMPLQSHDPVSVVGAACRGSSRGEGVQRAVLPIQHSSRTPIHGFGRHEFHQFQVCGRLFLAVAPGPARREVGRPRKVQRPSLPPRPCSQHQEQDRPRAGDDGMPVRQVHPVHHGLR